MTNYACVIHVIVCCELNEFKQREFHRESLAILIPEPMRSGETRPGLFP